MKRVAKDCLTSDECFERLVPVNATPSEAFDIGWTARGAQPVSKRYKLDADFLRACAKHFRDLPTGGEDLAHWANIYNASNCERISQNLEAMA